MSEADKNKQQIMSEIFQYNKKFEIMKEKIDWLTKSFGPNGNMTHILRRLDEKDKRIKDLEHQNADLALRLSGDFNPMVEAERMVNEDRENTLALTARMVKEAGSLPHLFSLLADPETFCDEHFDKVNSLLNELTVWREYRKEGVKAPRYYGDILSRSRECLRVIKSDIGEHAEES